MNVLILYDSVYGNTEKVARAIAGAFGKSKTVKLVQASRATYADLASVDFFIVGSPTRGGRPTPALQQYLNAIPAGALKGVKVAAFDTRLDFERVDLFVKLLMKMIGYAAPKTARILVSKSGTLAVPPEGFLVEGKEGPLKKNELMRAASWAASKNFKPR